jgi:hypothetical protein
MASERAERVVVHLGLCEACLRVATPTAAKRWRRAADRGMDCEQAIMLMCAYLWRNPGDMRGVRRAEHLRAML